MGIAILDGLHPEPGLATTVDFDNYDELTDSIDMFKEATHDTNGIVTQNRKAIPASPLPELNVGPSRPTRSSASENEPQLDSSNTSNSVGKSRKRRKKLDKEDEDIAPFK